MTDKDAMTAAHVRIEFDATLDEVVDVGMRMVRRTGACQRARRRSQWSFGVALPLLFLAASGTFGRADSAGDWGIVVAAGVGVGLGSGFLYGRFHDSLVRSHCRHALAEMHAGATSLHCEVELRPENLWIKQNDLEQLFPWHRATMVNDRGDAVELWFSQGLVVLRNRVFASPATRRDTLESARTLANKAVQRPLPSDGGRSDREQARANAGREVR